jgi:hypothetical protein
MGVLQRLKPRPRPEFSETGTADEREELLNRAIADQQRSGWRLTARSRFQGVLVKGRGPNHALHLILTLVTFGLWGIVWPGLFIFGGEKRQVAAVDEHGHIHVQR